MRNSNKTSNKAITSKTAISTHEKPTQSKLDRLLAELERDDGATIDDLAAATGWQKHSVRGAMAGSLKRKGHAISSSKVDGVRRYSLVGAA